MSNHFTALQTINKLQATYTGNKFQFDVDVAMYISGDHNKILRQEIMRIVTGEKKPLTKCGMHAVANELKIKFDQLQMF